MLTDPKDDNIRQRLRDGGVWEADATKIVLGRFRGGTFIDVGAHWGYYSMLLAKQVDRIFALEPNPRMFGILLENVRLNGFSNITPLQIAAWDKKTRIQATDPENDRNTGAAKVGEAENGNVWGERLDELFKPEEVQFIKIDCEGEDSRVLKGAEKILRVNHSEILVESPPTDFLVSLGYTPIFYSNNMGQGPTHLWVKNFNISH